MSLPRGIRNNNPGNIRDTNIPWEGVVQTLDPDGVDTEQTFEEFRRPWWGIRALAVNLRTYQQKRGCKTLRQIISRWAPGHENPTDAYAAHVSRVVGCGIDDPVNLDDYFTLQKLVVAIIEFENGRNPYTWEVCTGLILAGVEPPQPVYE